MSNRGCFVNRAKRAAKRRMIAEVGRCMKCGSIDKLTIDHKIPHKYGGSNAQSNWLVLCEECNHKKGVGFYDL